MTITVFDSVTKEQVAALIQEGLPEFKGVQVLSSGNRLVCNALGDEANYVVLVPKSHPALDGKPNPLGVNAVVHVEDDEHLTKALSMNSVLDREYPGAYSLSVSVRG